MDILGVRIEPRLQLIQIKGPSKFRNKGEGSLTKTAEQ